mgnify:CR=1 FL=1|jgi:hypothetical protein
MSDGSDSSKFPEMDAHAKQAASEFRENPPPLERPPGVKGSLEEDYRQQLDLNHEAHRRMRWWAFIGLGTLIALFLVFLLVALTNVFNHESVSVLVAAGSGLNWHILVFLSVVAAIFAAVPLSLAMALVKMISLNQHHGDEGDYKTPTTELGKVILDLLKSMVQAAKAS